MGIVFKNVSFKNIIWRNGPVDLVSLFLMSNFSDLERKTRRKNPGPGHLGPRFIFRNYHREEYCAHCFAILFIAKQKNEEIFELMGTSYAWARFSSD